MTTDRPTSSEVRANLAAGHGKAAEQHERRAQQRLAKQYQPDRDPEMERLAVLDGLSPQAKMEIGLHRRAKAAAEIAGKQ